jgi:hypothetical protein
MLVEIELGSGRNGKGGAGRHIQAIVNYYRLAVWQNGVLLYNLDSMPMYGIPASGHKGYVLDLSTFQTKTEAVGMGSYGIGIAIRQGYLHKNEDTIVSPHLEISTPTILEELSIHIHPERTISGMLQTYLIYSQSIIIPIVDQQTLCAATYCGYNGIETDYITTEREMSLRVCSPRIIIIATADHRQHYTYYIYI